MKLHTLAAAAALCLAVSAPALAADGQVSATLQSPVAAKTKVVAGGTVFQCVEASCVAAYASDRAKTPAACKQLVKEVGPVSAYGKLDESALARCNGAVTGTN